MEKENADPDECEEVSDEHIEVQVLRGCGANHDDDFGGCFCFDFAHEAQDIVFGLDGKELTGAHRRVDLCVAGEVTTVGAS